MSHVSATRRVVGLRRAALLSLLLTLLLGAATAVQAQQIDSTLAARFQLAESYLRAGQFDRAIYQLEDLYAAQPGTYVFYERLKEAYENVKRYDDAMKLVEGRMQTEGRNPLLLSELARLYYLKGDEPAAYKAWEEAVAVDAKNRNTYRIVFQSLYEVRLFDRAIHVLEQGRERLGGDVSFEADLAYLYNLTGRHEEAVQAYLKILGENPRQLGFVRSRLGRFMEQPEALEAGIRAAERAVRKTPLNRAYRELLSWFYLEAKQYAKAFETNLAIDRLEQENGRVLFTFAQSAADAGAYDVALKAYEEVLARYPDAPSAPDALLGLGVMHEQWARVLNERTADEHGNRRAAPHFELALETYRTFLQKYPTHAFYPDALRRIGRLQQDVFHDLSAAETTLQEVVRRYPGTPAANEAEYDLARIAFLRGRLDEARLVFTRLVERLRTGELAEKARYDLALLHFYKGEFDAAQSLAEVLNENTSTEVANDAIELKVLLIANKGPDSLSSPLQIFARAHMLERQRRAPEALQRVDSLLQRYPQHSLNDDARFLRARALRAIGRTEEAYTAFRELPLMHPASYLADRSLFTAAEILERELNRKDEAIQLYTQLLTDYPGSLFASEARSRIRALRGDGI